MIKTTNHRISFARALPTLLSISLALSGVGLSACSGGSSDAGADAGITSSVERSVDSVEAEQVDNNASVVANTSADTSTSADDADANWDGYMSPEAEQLLADVKREIGNLKVTTDSGKTSKLVDVGDDMLYETFNVEHSSAMSLVASFDHEIDEEERVAWRDYLQSEEVTKTFAAYCTKAHELALEAGGDTDDEVGLITLKIEAAWPGNKDGKEAEDLQDVDIWYRGDGDTITKGDLFWAK